MATTEEKITQDMKAAMRAHDELAVSVLRMLKSAIHNAVIAKRVKKLDEPDAVKVLQSQAKQRQDSITAFRAGNRVDLAEKEEKERKIIETYLPQQLSEDEIKKIVRELIAGLPAAGGRNFGAIMKSVMAKVAGQSDGQTVSRIVKEALA